VMLLGSLPAHQFREQARPSPAAASIVRGGILM
jgi:hypothetical protein